MSIILVGDIHGRFDQLILKINRANITDANIIQVGDFGLGFQSFEDDHTMLFGLNEYLISRNCKLYVIRGNHDNPSYWSNSSFEFSNIVLVPDYTVLTIDNKKILFVGGAISIDRKYRQQSKGGYWEEEVFSYDQDKLDKLDLTNLDWVVTHSAPQFAYPRDFGSIVYYYAHGDKTLINDLLMERQKIDQLASYLEHNQTVPSHWVYGHFHSNNEEDIKNTKYVLLGILEFKTIT